MIKTYYCFLTTVISLTIFLSCKEESKKVYLEKDIKKEIIGEQDQIDLKATQSILQKAKKACPELVGIGIGIDPLMANWETLPKLSIELKKMLKFDISDGDPIKLNSYKVSDDNLYYIITVHKFVDMEKRIHVGKLSAIRDNKLIGTIDVASFSNIYSDQLTYSIFETDNKLKIHKEIYPEPEEVGELNTTKDSILVLTKIIDLKTMSTLDSSKKWEIVL